MLFNSFVFWAFFVVVLALYRVLPHKGQNRLLLVASYVFYGYWDWRFLSLILISTVVDFFVAHQIEGTDARAARKRWVALSVCVNLGILAFFKYYGFFAAELNELLAAIGLRGYLPLLEILLPVGISFYTFQTISYSVDVFRGQTRPARDFLDFALYVSFFPQLVAGPIERSHRLLPQVETPRSVTGRDRAVGLYLIAFGLFKKIVIADNMAVIANFAFLQPEGELQAGMVLLGVYAFAFQIYGDFSGYSSIAQGLARLMGFELMWNFRMPYFSGSPSEFWLRWHISLSSWLRDYLYIPLGGNRAGSIRTARNLSATMLLGGLWHGANWTFILWGAFHGLILVIYRGFPALGGDSAATRGWSRIARVLLTFHLVCLGWVFFRAESAGHAFAMLGALGDGWGELAFSGYAAGMLTVLVLPLLVYEGWLEKRDDQLALLDAPWPVQAAGYAYLIVTLLILVPLAPQVFIYFQF